MCQWTPTERAWEDILVAFMLQISSCYSLSINYCAHVVPSAFLTAHYTQIYIILVLLFTPCWMIVAFFLLSGTGVQTSRFHVQTFIRSCWQTRKVK